jgi:hypothetical protein
VLLGYLGWRIIDPGGSLVVPALIVFGARTAIAALATLATRSPRSSGHRRALLTFGVAALAWTLLASVWTYEFAVPLSVAWSDADQQAQTALTQPTSTTIIVPGPGSLDCTLVSSGSVGPIEAPYRRCVDGGLVFFSSVGSNGGIAYDDSGRVPPQQGICYRHLYGPWWLLHGKTDPMADCPFGYDFLPIG